MRIFPLFGCVCLCVLLLGGVVDAVGQDWPQWRGVNRDGKASAFAVPSSWPESLDERWRVTVGLGDSSPSLVGDRLYVFARQGAEEVALCLDAGTGEELWRESYPAPEVKGAARGHGGPRSSPTVADGKVVLLGVAGTLTCLDAKTGRVLWRKDEFPEAVPAFHTAMSPLIAEGVCIAHLGGKEKGALIAYDLNSGEEKWRWSGDGPAYASPSLMTVEGTAQVVLETDSNIVGVALADGRLLWQIPFPQTQRSTNASSPVVDGQTVIYSAPGRGTKAVRIEREGDAFEVRDVWSNADLGTGFNTPVLRDGHLFGLSDRGHFYCMNATTGEVLWTDEAPHGRFGAIVDGGSALLALPSDGELIVYAPGRGGYEELARYTVSETPVYAHLVVSGNRIFVKDKDTVVMMTVD